MRFLEFAVALRKMGAQMNDVYRLDHDGRRSADDAHRGLWLSGGMPEIKSENDFKSLCAHIGREFVICNIEDIFLI